MATVSAGREYESLTHLQIALCRVLYLMNTSRIDLANSALQVVCRSFMLQQLIRSVSTNEPAYIDFADMSSRNIVWTVFYLDMHISSLLKVSPSLPLPGPEMATVYAINTAIHNVNNHYRSESTFLCSVSVAMAIELMKLMQLMSHNLEKSNVLSSPQSVKGKAAARESPTREEVRAQCETWELFLQAAFTDDECNPTLLMSVLAIILFIVNLANPWNRARRQLQMHLHLAQITLYHCAIGDRSRPVPWHHVPRVNEFKEEAACVQAAVDAVKYTSSQLEQGQTDTISWHSAYIVFISAVTLLAAAVHMNASDHAATHRVISTATMILSNASYGSWHAKSCYIQFIQVSPVLARAFSH